MAEYYILWEIELNADSPEEAAEEALGIQRDKNSSATTFIVFDTEGGSKITDGVINGDGFDVYHIDASRPKLQKLVEEARRWSASTIHYALQRTASLLSEERLVNLFPEYLAAVEVESEADTPRDLHECQNCNFTCDEPNVIDPVELCQRVTPGEPMPSGECPECGGLMHPRGVTNA